MDPTQFSAQRPQDDVLHFHGPLHGGLGVAAHGFLLRSHPTPTAHKERSNHLLSGAVRSCAPDTPLLPGLDSGSGGRDLSPGPAGKEERLAAAKGLLEFPRSAVAEFKDGKLTGWTASQATHLDWDTKRRPTLIDLHGGLDGDGQPRPGQEADRRQTTPL